MTARERIELAAFLSVQPQQVRFALLRLIDDDTERTRISIAINEIGTLKVVPMTLTGRW